jgi:hypothetical protein
MHAGHVLREALQGNCIAACNVLMDNGSLRSHHTCTSQHHWSHNQPGSLSHLPYRWKSECKGHGTSIERNILHLVATTHRFLNHPNKRYASRTGRCKGKRNIIRNRPCRDLLSKPIKLLSPRLSTEFSPLWSVRSYPSRISTNTTHLNFWRRIRTERNGYIATQSREPNIISRRAHKPCR